MIEILMAYLNWYYWYMGKLWKNMCQNLCRIIKENPLQKIDFRNVQKTEHIK